ncbi:hypothetical protein K6X12_06380 [Xanthomonas euvesicatoria pv. allii]|uniref:hypothetical protein n=1 Tax=Xanthomonas euvesicatoria TaxID=456327 RepID=UPI002405F513|nr:hypothetical protein [Xanthomonas euvesicatoria]MCP3050723.1 hypothetical protein [Xanthomonas euvesicatoria pv. allii]
MTPSNTNCTTCKPDQLLEGGERMRLARRKRLPADAVEHDAGVGDGSAYYTWQSRNLVAVAFFSGRKTVHPSAYRFPSQALANDYIESWTASRQLAADTAKQQRQRHSLTVGQVLFSSWGYDQTNVDFYQVVAVRGAVVDLHELAKSSKPVGHMSAHVRPLETFVGEPLRNRRPNGFNTLKVDGIHLAPWNGQTLTATSYA